MAIQHRRGKKVDFDPQKMLPGEWAVSIDAETENQIIWMCFRPGVVKRMGTYEDFREQILEITDDIREEFSQTINEIKVYMEGLKSDTEGYKNTAEQKAAQASISATNAANSADLSEDYAGKAQSYAKGTGGVVRPNDDSDCAEFYYEQVKRISQGVEGIIPMGTITFAELALPYNEIPRYMFDISDEFVTDERFKNGSGIYYGAGSNVIRTADDMWDVLAPTAVYGVKGDKESVYRQGFVNLTPEDIGAATVEDLSGINADFVGTTAELEAKIEAGEITDGMTVYLTDGGSDSSGGGEVSEDLQERIEALEEKTKINTWNNAGIVEKANKPYKEDLYSGYPLEYVFTWSQSPRKGSQPAWIQDWRTEYTYIIRSGSVSTGTEIEIDALDSPTYYILEFRWIGANIGTHPKKFLLDAVRIFREMQYYGNYGKVAGYTTYDGDSDKIVEEFKIYDESFSSIGNFMVAFHFAKREADTNYSYRLIIDKYTVTGLRSGIRGNLVVDLHGRGTSKFS